MPSIKAIPPLYNAPASAAIRARALTWVALVCLGFSGWEFSQRLLDEARGTIVSTETTTGNRPVSIYRLRDSDGNEREYVAGPTDLSLPRHLPIGTHVLKRRFQFSWERDGKVINDFPITIYSLIGGIGLALAVGAGKQWRRYRVERRTGRGAQDA